MTEARATRRLYWEDASTLQFDSVVATHSVWRDRPSVILVASAFYPEAGGQPGDRGQLGDCSVFDTQIDAAGAIHHVLDGPLPSVGQTVSGRIDGPLRRLHMALHTGQHMLSRALLLEAGAATRSSRLAETRCTIDLALDTVTSAQVARAESIVNDVIDENRAVRAWFPDPEELAGMELRRTIKVADNVRVVAVDDFDATPCGGTHCATTAGVGLVRVEGVERYKGGLRVSFSAGARARRRLIERSEALEALERRFTCDAAGVMRAVDKLSRAAADTRETLALTNA
ncbi:MAG: alanyl-tRNA synthetase, partial [Myxococcota bacterium]